MDLFGMSVGLIRDRSMVLWIRSMGQSVLSSSLSVSFSDSKGSFRVRCVRFLLLVLGVLLVKVLLNSPLGFC